LEIKYDEHNEFVSKVNNNFKRKGFDISRNKDCNNFSITFIDESNTKLDGPYIKRKPFKEII